MRETMKVRHRGRWTKYALPDAIISLTWSRGFPPRPKISDSDHHQLKDLFNRRKKGRQSQHIVSHTFYLAG